jgi:hypothetical protein
MEFCLNYANIILMTKKTRLIILLVCVTCFFTITPVLVFYAMGERFDFKKMRIVATGGIYARFFPAADLITIDSKISQKPGFLAQVQGQGSVFVQSLLPQEHTISITKDGYYDYFKTLPVREKEVTKLENVLLIKKSILFPSLSSEIDFFSLATNNQNIITLTNNTKNITLKYSPVSGNNPVQTLTITQIGKIIGVKWSNDSSKALIEIQGYSNTFYYLFDSTTKEATVARLTYLDKTAQQISFNPNNSKEIFFIKNKILYLAKDNKTTSIIKNPITYKFSGNNIVWLSTDGLLYSADTAGKSVDQLTEKKAVVSLTQNYQIFVLPEKMLLQADNSLFIVNQDTKILEDITPPLTNYSIIASQDENKNLNLVLWSNEKIYLYSFSDTLIGSAKKFNKLFSGSNIKNCQWLNNSYIIFTEGDKIVISEIDYRGNINAITLPQTENIKSDPKIYFNQQDGKLYILTDNNLLVSDKITP